MNKELKKALLDSDNDIEGALYRMGGDEELYIDCLRAFMADPTMGELKDAMDAQAWDRVFTAAHALKGVAGNMGFVNLFHSAAELVILARNGLKNEVKDAYPELLVSYKTLIGIIDSYAAQVDTRH